jgi:hypothetical protein
MLIERSQNIGYAPRILHAEPPSVPGRKKPFEGIVAERTDHIQNVRQQLTGVDRSPTELREARRDDNLRRNSPKNNKITLHRR